MQAPHWKFDNFWPAHSLKRPIQDKCWSEKRACLWAICNNLPGSVLRSSALERWCMAAVEAAPACRLAEFASCDHANSPAARRQTYLYKLQCGEQVDRFLRIGGARVSAILGKCAALSFDRQVRCPAGNKSSWASAVESMVTVEEVPSLRVVDLKAELKARDLPISGLKAALVDRLVEALKVALAVTML